MADEQITTTEEKKTEEKKPAETLPAASKSKVKSKKKKASTKYVLHGRAYVQSTYNNTIVTLTDERGNVIAWSSAGKVGFKGPKKSTPYAASVISRDVVEKAKNCGLKDVDVFVKGVGSGREAAVRALHANGLEILSIRDITPIPHNGCKPPKPRRV
jgi:small subunit ribosomal protein S11